MQLAYVVDFDGTVTTNDITSILAKRYAGAAASQVYRRYRQGEIGMKEWLDEMVRYFPADQEEMLSIACEAADFRPGFAQFIQLAHDAERPLYIASDGFGFYMKPILERHGFLKYIDGIYGNRLVIGSDDSVIIETPHFTPDCGLCGNCKAAHVVELKDKGYRVVYIGNGLNDRFGATHADLIFARAGDRLAEYCSAHKIAFTPFNDFHDIIEFAYPEKLTNRIDPLCKP